MYAISGAEGGQEPSGEKTFIYKIPYKNGKFAEHAKRIETFHADNGRALVMLNNGNLLSGGSDSLLYITDPKQHVKPYGIQTDGIGIRRMDVSKDGKKVLVLWNDGAGLWDIPTAE